MTIRGPSLLVALVAIAICLVRSVASADDGDSPPDFSNLGGDAVCPGFRCGSGTSPVQNSRSKFVSKGCSKMGGGMIAGLGGGAGLGGEKYASCCDRWHACYQTCGAPKRVCDEAFKSCSNETCGDDDECKKSADMNSLLLGLGGCGMYDQGQAQACECVPKNKREEKRAAALRSFYKKFAPDGLDKVDGLAKKVDTTAKLSALIRKLHAKYPDSIKVVVDDEMARMQEMMRKATEGADKETVKDEEDGADDVGDTEEL